MKQLIQNMKSGALAIEEVPSPQPGVRGVLVENRFSVISAGTEKSLVDLGSKSMLGKARSRPDLVKQVVKKVQTEGLAATYSKVMNRLEAPSPLGYSAAGIVRETGVEVPGIQPGDRVACGGAGYANHAELIAVPRNLVVPIPDGVFLEAAAFTTVGAIALQGVRLAAPLLGEKFLVIGLGLLGQLTVQLLRANGCEVVATDLQPDLVTLAEKFGAVGVGPGEDAVQACLATTGGHGVDGVLICAGTQSNQPIELAGEASRLKGRVVVVGAVGMELPRPPYFKKELNLVVSRSYGPGRYDPVYEEGGEDYPLAYVRFTEQRNMEAFLGLIASGGVDLEPLITHRFAFEKAAEAYGIIQGERTEPYLGILLEYGEAQQAAGPGRIDLQPAPLPSGKIGVSVIGGGNYVTGVLLPIIKARAETALNGLTTASGRTAQGAGKKFGFRYAGDDVAALLADESQLAVVGTRHDSHGALTIQALEAGKHVYVEKPLALTEAELAGVVAALTAKPDRQVHVGFNRRFAPLVRQAAAHLAGVQGPKTVMIRVNAGAIPMDHWTQDPAQGGRIIGEACHFIDLAAALTGSDVVSVVARGVKKAEKSPLLNDNVGITLTHADGSVATILYTADGPRGMSKEFIEAFGGGRGIVIDDFRGGRLYDERGGSKKLKGGPQDKGQRGMIDALFDGLASGKPALPFESAALTSLAAIRVVASLATGQALSVSLEDLDSGSTP